MSLLPLSKNSKNLYTPVLGVEVIYDGNKIFWKTNESLDVVLVLHSKLNTLEIIAYNPDKGHESNRIYLNTLLLAGRIDQIQLQNCIADRKESAIRRKQMINLHQITKTEIHKAMTNFVLTRLHMTYEDNKILKIELTPYQSDSLVTKESIPQLDVICIKPENLTPFEVHFKRIFR